MTKEDPETLNELCDFITVHANRIAVRTKVEDKWQSLFLIQLSPQKAIEEAMRFIKEGRVPYIVLEKPKYDIAV